MRNITKDRINELQNRIRDDMPILNSGINPQGHPLREEIAISIRRGVERARTELVRLIKSLHPKLGMGATMYGWSDRHAGTIVWVSRSKKQIKVQRDRARLLNGPNSGEPDALRSYPGGFCTHVEGRQRYDYRRDPDGDVVTFSLRKNGRWIREGDGLNGYRCDPGIRAEYYDFNF